ncbi:MAG: flavodoxin-dependent (E)-4-hydroxy-3-methylbut-2-enyl-diphosphate synthase [Ruminococcus sp.]|jgi:(E)-4-hydroxy-3-methylbut-2-enyl-diphosphate synthase|nr:flavodoxin-dependent (E)-4-hydroxy-3-methylbut-2-enyl-diphosphate synthase [Ruminococcus sp.]
MIKVGNLPFDGRNIYVQSMLNRIASDTEGNVLQAKRLEAAGCEIVRVSVPKKENVTLITELKKAVKIPVVADIHFDADIAVLCAEAGADKIRINPGNIGTERDTKRVADACRAAGIPIRVGANSGSVPKHLIEKYGGAAPEAIAEAALENAAVLERHGFYDTVISVKSSDVFTMIKANRILAEKSDYPLHLGVTEAGTYHTGLIKSAAGIGALLADGIGATIRVSLTDEPEREVEAGYDILKALGKKRGIRLISCPTCGRTQIDIIKIAAEVEKAIAGIDKDLTVAVMGCVVNGPGEAKEADIGIAGGKGCAVLFRKGEKLRTVPEAEIVSELLKEINEYAS